MGEEDERRVEARLTGANRGVSPTTEQIQTLLQRRAEHDKMTRPPPRVTFAQLLNSGGGAAGDPAVAQGGPRTAPAVSDPTDPIPPTDASAKAAIRRPTPMLASYKAAALAAALPQNLARAQQQTPGAQAKPSGPLAQAAPSARPATPGQRLGPQRFGPVKIRG